MKLSGTKRAERLSTVYSPAKNSTTGSNSRTTQSSVTHVWPKPPSRPRPTAAYTRSSRQKPERDSDTHNSDTRRRSIAPERDAVRTSPRESSPPRCEYHTAVISVVIRTLTGVYCASSSDTDTKSTADQQASTSRPVGPRTSKTTRQAKWESVQYIEFIKQWCSERSVLSKSILIFDFDLRCNTHVRSTR